MATLDLTDEERALVLEVLRSAYMDLRAEIADTDTSTYKEMLHKRERMLEQVMEKLASPA